MKNELPVVVLFLLFVALALATVLFLARNLRQHREAAGFLETPGTISVSTVERRPGLKPTRPVDNVELVKYRYTVDGTDYENDLYSFVRRSWDEKDLAEYPVGKEVTVYYDPANPANSVLSRGADPFFYVSVCLIFPAALYFCLVLPVQGLLEWKEKRHRVGFMLFSERDGLKILKMAAFKPLVAAGLAWFFACLTLCMIAMVVEIPAVTLGLAVLCLIVGALVYVIARLRAGKQIVWIVTPEEGTLDFTDPYAPQGRTTVAFDRISGFQIRPGRSAWAEFYQKWIDPNVSTAAADLFVDYCDSTGQSRSGKLVSINEMFHDDLETLRHWLVSECRRY